MAPNGAGRFFFRLIQTLPTFWAEWILILRSFIFYYLLDPTISRFPGSYISRFPENRSLFVGRPFFRKLSASKNDAERYRRNILGPNFQKHPLFQFKGPRFLEALNLWVRCRRRLFFSQKNGPHIFGSPKLVGTLPQAPFFSEKWASSSLGQL